MTSQSGMNIEPVRLLFEMTRDDNPRLYDDLIRFNKGTKRVNRLRFLAYEGLLAQLSPVEPEPIRVSANSKAFPAAQSIVNPEAARQTNHAFDTPPVDKAA